MFIRAEQEALISRMFETYVTEHHHGDIIQLIADTAEETHHPVVINAMTLFEANMEVGDYFNAYPSEVLAIFDKVLHKAAMDVSKNAASKHFRGQRAEEQRLRHTLHARITGLPVCPELSRDTIPRSRDVGHFLSVTGTVIRTSVAKVLEYERDYMCSKCRHVFMVQADFDQFYSFVPPAACPNPDGCNSYKFSCLSGGSEPATCRDYQEIKIQEQVQRLSVGSIPRSMVVVLEEDLVDSCKSGDDVTVYGVMRQRWKPFYDATRCDVELVLKANNIEVNNQQGAAALLMEDVQKEFAEFWENYKHDPVAGRNQILLSLCPQVFGMYVIKLAVAMVLAGGVQRIDSSGTKIRGECHMLLVGDPGTGKSQFLKYAAKIMPRSVLTAGIGSTSAGLTVAAVKDGGEWHLEAGALVLSDGGLCCIDEFNSIKEHDRISIHEAMEQQSISVAKAGIVCKLNTRTTILAATNPKSQYDPNEPLSVNVALASPLLSRFDLVLVLLDTRNKEWDRVISAFILEDRGLPPESSSLWSMEKMKAYFCTIRRLQPQVSEDANCILTTYYQLQRQSEGRSAARTTIRMLESLSRLAEAHARLLYRETVTIEDAVMAVSVMECSMQGGGLLGNVNAILTSFPADPCQQYQMQCRTLLEGLNLPLLLQKETERLARVTSRASEAPTHTHTHTPTPTPDHRTDHHRSRLKDSTNKTLLSNITSNSQGGAQVEAQGGAQVEAQVEAQGDAQGDSGLDWFYSITPSLSSHEMTSPVSTSTQRAVSKTPTSSRCSSSSPSHQEGGAVSTESEDRRNNRTITPQTVQDPGRHQDREHPVCVIQKVSKNLRDRRVRELQRRQQGGAGHGRREGEGEGEGEGSVGHADKDPHCSSILLSGDHPDPGGTSRVRDSRSGRGGPTGTNNFTSVLKEKMAAQTEAGEDIHAKLSSFIFQPRKTRPLVHSRGPRDPSGVGAEPQTERSITGRHANTDCRDGQKKAASHESASPVKDAEEGRRKLQSQTDSKDGGMRRQTSRLDERPEDGVGLQSLEEEEHLSFRHDESAVGETESQHRNTGIKPVTSSTLTRLSRFSFTCTSGPTPPTSMGGGRPPGRPQRRDAANDQDKIRSPEESPLRKKIRTADRMSHVKVVPPPPPSSDLRPGRELKPPAPTKTGSECSGTHEESARPAHGGENMVPGLPADVQTTDRGRKRKCFELGPPSSHVGGSSGLFSNMSLFGSADLHDDVLDTDWEQEIF